MKEIRTSDRILYKRCRRKFNLQSALRHNYEYKGEDAIQLWLGSGIHFALEDFHGYKKFETPLDAFNAYWFATKADKSDNPAFEEARVLGLGMLAEYCSWIPGLKGFETLWVAGVPMCEVKLRVPMPELGADVYYSATIDRLLIDAHKRIWMLDYKTAKKIDKGKLATDPQITSYYWALFEQYGLEVEGMIYIQMLKEVPEDPAWLKSNKFSQAKGQATTYGRYRAALMEKYGQIPIEYNEYLNMLKGQSSFLDYKYISIDFVRRNELQINAEHLKMLYEGAEMIDPELKMYPNPTRDCSWDCRFRQVCIGMDDGSDWKQMLSDNFVKRSPEDESWRKRIQWPQTKLGADVPEDEIEAFSRDLLGQ